jgi:hypothetical protein
LPKETNAIKDGYKGRYKNCGYLFLTDALIAFSEDGYQLSSGKIQHEDRQSAL